MNKNTKVIIGVIIVIAAVWGGYGVYQKSPATRESITIGFVAPLTGDAATYGMEGKNAVTLALSEINAAGGINGKTLNVVYEDGKCSGKDALAAAQKLISTDKVPVILGGECSGETLAIAPIAEQNKVVIMSSFSSSPDITNAGDYVFRNFPSDFAVVKGYVQYIVNKEGYKNVAIITENTDYGVGVRKVFVDETNNIGGTVVADEMFKQGERDFRAIIVKIKATNPQAIFITPQTGVTVGTAVKQIREAGIKTPIFSTYLFGGEDGLKAAGTAANDVVFFDAAGLSGEKGNAFINKYTSAYGKIAGSAFFTGARYDSVFIIANALKKCGEDTGCIKNYLYGMNNYDGAIGSYTFDANGDVVGIALMAPKVIKNGKIEDVK